MKVLGIDPGSLITGYGVVEKGKGGSLLCLSGGRVRLDPSAPFPERLLAISEKITSVIREFRPEAVSVESIFFAKNARSAIILGHVRGVVLLSAAASRVPVFEYDPRTIKLSVTGYGAATKDQMQKMVKALLSASEETAFPALAPASDMRGWRGQADTADALAAAICHIHSYRGVGGSNRKWAVG